MLFSPRRCFYAQHLLEHLQTWPSAALAHLQVPASSCRRDISKGCRAASLQGKAGTEAAPLLSLFPSKRWRGSRGLSPLRVRPQGPLLLAGEAGAAHLELAGSAHPAPAMPGQQIRGPQSGRCPAARPISRAGGGTSSAPPAPAPPRSPPGLRAGGGRRAGPQRRPVRGCRTAAPQLPR